MPHGANGARREALKEALWGDDRKGYEPRFIRKFGPAAGLFLSQLLFWEGRGWDEDGWIWKTEREMDQETGLTRFHQRKARKILTAAGVLEEVRRGVPCRMHYRIDLEALANVLGIKPPVQTVTQGLRTDQVDNPMPQTKELGWQEFLIGEVSEDVELDGSPRAPG